MPNELTPTQRLAGIILGVDLREWVAERREPVVRRSWRQIAAELDRTTDHQVNVTGESLRLWYSDVDDRWPATTEAVS